MLTYEIYLPEQKDILDYLLTLDKYQPPQACMDFRINGNWVMLYRTINPWCPQEVTYHVQWKWKSAARQKARSYEVSGTFEECRKFLFLLEKGTPEFLQDEEDELREERDRQYTKREKARKKKVYHEPTIKEVWE